MNDRLVITPDMLSPEPPESPSSSGWRDRFFNFATSLRDNNAEKTSLVGRLKRATAENILSFQDKEFRQSFYMLTGSMALAMASTELAITQPSPAVKVVGMAVAGMGVHQANKETFNLHTVHNQLHGENQN